jgi:hypothetical protein
MAMTPTLKSVIDSCETLCAQMPILNLDMIEDIFDVKLKNKKIKVFDSDGSGILYSSNFFLDNVNISGGSYLIHIDGVFNLSCALYINFAEFPVEAHLDELSSYFDFSGSISDGHYASKNDRAFYARVDRECLTSIWLEWPSKTPGITRGKGPGRVPLPT